MFKLDDYRVETTQVFKLKDKPGKQFFLLDLKKEFGEGLEFISVEKVMKRNNKMVVRGFIRKQNNEK